MILNSFHIFSKWLQTSQLYPGPVAVHRLGSSPCRLCRRWRLMALQGFTRRRSPRPNRWISEETWNLHQKRGMKSEHQFSAKHVSELFRNVNWNWNTFSANGTISVSWAMVHWRDRRTSHWDVWKDGDLRPFGSLEGSNPSKNSRNK